MFDVRCYIVYYILYYTIIHILYYYILYIHIHILLYYILLLLYLILYSPLPSPLPKLLLIFPTLLFLQYSSPLLSPSSSSFPLYLPYFYNTPIPILPSLHSHLIQSIRVGVYCWILIFSSQYPKTDPACFIGVDG